MPRPAKGARLWFDRKAGLWFVRDGSSKRSTSCRQDERAGAEEALRVYIAEKYEPPSDSRPARLLVTDVLTFYNRTIAPGQKSTTTGYAVDRLLDWWHSKPLSEVKRSTCQAYVEYRMTQPIRQAKKTKTPKLVGSETARRELTVLRAAINAYHAETPLDALPVVTLPEASDARKNWLRREQAARLIRAARAMEDKDAGRALVRLILVGVYTGTRSGAMRRLGWLPNTLGGYVDLAGGVIHRRGDEEDETKKRRPSIRIPDRLLGFLRRWHRLDMAIENPPGFVIHYRGAPVEKQRKSWNRARIAAGLGPEITPHILKHTAITWALQSGVSIWDAAGFFGTSAQVIEDVYGHHSPEFQKHIASRIGRR